MRVYLWIAFGSALGGIGRYWCGVMAMRLWPVEFPWGTVAINVLGSLVIGFFASFTESTGRFPLSLTVRQFVMVGLCGGFTTFSGFSLQTLMLAQDGRVFEAGLNIVLSVVLCLAGVALGHFLAVALG